MDKLLKLEKKTYSLTFFYVSLLGVWGHSSVRKATSNNNDLSTDLNAQGKEKNESALQGIIYERFIQVLFCHVLILVINFFLPFQSDRAS